MSKRPFEEIVEQHGATVFRVARAVVGPADAEDAWSETFLAAMRAYPALDEGANMEAWLVTIAHRKAIDLGRSQARRPASVGQPPDDRPATDGLPGHAPDDELWAAIRALPARQRQTVAYHYLADLPYAEVAAIVGGTAEAARRAAADGIRTLRRTYAPASEPTKGRSR
ncbi:MAG TPA: sigma-70 family RNA polymerase sigma factor [Candidatus Limnocylindrales bacterium]|nr:sigma-70 family RNA polymerase sigma factor [Candidatus Limnocylindrales bacterium]